MKQNNKICSVVFNSVSRDARVIKQAKSLANAGYDVTVVGVADQQFNLSKEVYENVVKIQRASLNGYIKTLAVFFKLLGLVIALSLIIFANEMKLLSELAIVTGLILVVRIFFYLYELFRVNNFSFPCTFQINLQGKISKAFWQLFKLVPFLRILIKIKPAVIHCHDIQTLPLGVIAKVILRCKLVYDAHEIYEEVPQVLLENGARLKTFKKIHNFSQGYIDSFVTINDSIATWYADKYPRLPKATVIMNAAVLSPLISYDGRLHDAAGINREVHILLYQGGFAEHRGLDFLVRSAEHLPKHWVLVMMGWGAHEEALRDLAKSVNTSVHASGRDDVVKFVPPAPQSDLVMWTAGGEIGVIPYENTGLNHWFCSPNKIWEFPNAGLPVLVSPFPELRKSVDAYGNGWLLPEIEDTSYIGRLISSLSPEQIKEASLNSRKFIEENNWSFYEKCLVELYSKIDLITTK